MIERYFAELAEWQRRNHEQLCVGLDTDRNLLVHVFESYPGLEQELQPHTKSLRTNADYVLAYNRMVIDATADLVGAYKPNKAFYEALGDQGFGTLRKTAEYVRIRAPYAMTILDAKIQDIGSTNAGYGTAYFDIMKLDAATVHPYLGSEALGVLTDRKDKGFLVMGRTSNPGAGEFQNLEIGLTRLELLALMNGPARSLGNDTTGWWPNMDLYKYVSLRVANHWNINGNCGLVAGATWPKESGDIRRLVGPDLFLLIPGVGAQGGEARDIVPEALRLGELGVINSSRGIIFAKRQKGETQFAAITRAAQTLHKEIRTAQELAA